MTFDLEALKRQRCTALRGAEHKLDDAALSAALSTLRNWQLVNGELVREFVDQPLQLNSMATAAFVMTSLK